MNRWNSLIKQAVNKVPIEGGLARGFRPTHQNYGTAVKFPCGQKTFYIALDRRHFYGALHMAFKYLNCT